MNKDLQQFIIEQSEYVRRVQETLPAEQQYHQMVAYQVIWWIIENVTDKTRLDFIVDSSGQLAGDHPEVALSQEQKIKIIAILKRHIEESYPLQYLLGGVEFAGLRIASQEPVLIPRVETEEWVVSFVNSLKVLNNSDLQSLTILDMCTGSGCIGLTVAHGYPQAEVTLVDLQDYACVLATKNKESNSISNARIIQSDLFQEIPEGCKFDCILTNPPYITQHEWEQLDPVVKAWEDKCALVSGVDGLDLIRKVINQSKKYLKDNSPIIAHNLPRLVIEIGYKQGLAVKALCEQAGFEKVEIVQDMAGMDRTVVCY